jgi:histone deacetylase 1/2
LLPFISLQVYRPGAVVLQCGADSLTGDRLGCFNLTVKGHGDCVKFVKSFGLPTLVLGGGGYNIRNVSRCWTYETAVLLDTPVNTNIPNNDFIQYYGPDYKLHLTPSDMQNLNDPKELEKTKIKLLQNLSLIEHAPSVQMQQVPPDFYLLDDNAHEDKADPNVRMSIQARDKEVQKKGEFFDGDEDQDTSKRENAIVNNDAHVMMDDE